MQNKAIERYNARAPELIGKWWVLISQARILASSKTADKMERLLYKIYDQDQKIVRHIITQQRLAEDASSRTDNVKWSELHGSNWQTLGEINSTIMELANDLGLIGEQSLR